MHPHRLYFRVIRPSHPHNARFSGTYMNTMTGHEKVNVNLMTPGDTDECMATENGFGRQRMDGFLSDSTSSVTFYSGFPGNSVPNLDGRLFDSTTP